MVIYQFRNIQNKFYFVECTVQAMFGCRIGETFYALVKEVKLYD